MVAGQHVTLTDTAMFPLPTNMLKRLTGHDENKNVMYFIDSVNVTLVLIDLVATFLILIST